MKIKTMLCGVMLAVTGAAAPVSAFGADVSEEPVACLTVTLTSGQTEHYRLSEQPVVTFPGTAMLVTSSEAEASYERAEVADFKLTMQVLKEESGLTSVAASDYQFSYLGGMLEISGEGVSRATIHTVSGVLAATVGADADGVLRYSVDSLAPGVYVVTPEGRRSVKIVK